MKKILIAEREIEIADLIRAILSGYENKSVTDGLEAYQEWCSSHYDLLIVGCFLPRMTGETVVKSIRESGDNRPIVMITADQTVSAGTAKGWGVNNLIYKPFDFDDLRQIIQRNLGS